MEHMEDDHCVSGHDSQSICSSVQTQSWYVNAYGWAGDSSSHPDDYCLNKFHRSRCDGALLVVCDFFVGEYEL